MHHYANIEDALYDPYSVITVAVDGKPGELFPALNIKAGRDVGELVIVSLIDADTV